MNKVYSIVDVWSQSSSDRDALSHTIIPLDLLQRHSDSADESANSKVLAALAASDADRKRKKAKRRMVAKARKLTR